MIRIKNLKKDPIILLKIIFFISLIIVTANTIIYFSEKFIFGDRFLFDDLLMNYCAGKIYSENISPYGFGLNGTPIPLIECMKNIMGKDWGMPAYLYSQTYLKFLSILSKLDFNILKKIWILISFISVITISFFAYKIFPIEKFKIIYPLLIFFSFGSISFSAMTTGNISNVIYPILAFSLFSLHKDYKFIFSLIITFISLIKPHFFLFIFIGLFVYEKKFLKYFFLSLIVIIFFNLYYLIFENKLFIEYLNQLKIVNTKEFYFSFNYNLGLKNIIESLPTNFVQLFNSYISAGPSLLKNFIFLFFISIIFIGGLIYRLSLKNLELNNECKNKLIALGVIILLLINPSVTIYDFYLFIPSFFYLVNVIKFDHLPIDQNVFKYLLMITCIIVQDINLPFLLSAISFFYIIFYSFKNVDVLGISYDKR